MNGSPPGSATALANAAWSLTRVIGPCTTGRLNGGAGSAAASTASRTPRTAAPTDP